MKILACVNVTVILLAIIMIGCDIKPEPTPTQEPTTTLNQYESFLLNNPAASEGFTPDEYEFALEHLERTPEVMDEPELYEAFNAKIKIEEDLLQDLGLYPPSETDWNEIILANWSDVYNRLYKDGEAQGAIAQSDLSERISNEKDREIYYMGLWVPDGLQNFNPSTDWSWPNPNRLPYGTLIGRDAVVENLNNMPVLASNIMQAYNEPDSELHQRAPYHHGVPGHGTHGEPAIPVPDYILSEIRANPDKYRIPIIGPGQSIGFVPNLQATEADGIPYLEFRMPNGFTLIEFDEKYDLSNKN
jgi:hypothetical protein